MLQYLLKIATVNTFPLLKWWYALCSKKQASSGCIFSFAKQIVRFTHLKKSPPVKYERYAFSHKECIFYFFCGGKVCSFVLWDFKVCFLFNSCHLLHLVILSLMLFTLDGYCIALYGCCKAYNISLTCCILKTYKTSCKACKAIFNFLYVRTKNRYISK